MELNRRENLKYIAEMMKKHYNISSVGDLKTKLTQDKNK